MLYEQKTNCVVYRDNAGQIHEFANTKVGFIRHIKYLIDQTLFTQPWDTTARERFNRDYNYYCERHGVSAITPAPQDYIYGAFAYQAYEKILYLVGTKYSTLIDQAARYLEEKATKVNDLAPSPMSYYLDYGRLYDGCDNRYLRPINMVRGYSITGRRTFYRDEVFEVEDCYGNVYNIEKSLKKHLKTCEDCGSKYFNQDDFTSRQCDCLPQDLVGIYCYCRECALDRDWRSCDVCGRLEDSCNMYWIEGDEELICEDCYESGDYACCDHCGDYYRTDSDYAIYTEDGHGFCCDSCAEREGYAWDEDNECWDSEENINSNRLIADYHSTYFAFVGILPKGAKRWLGSGTEIEVVGPDPEDYEDFWRDRVIGHYLQNGKYGTVEHDGTVTAEIVLQPMTEQALKDFDLEGLMRELVEHDYTGHNNDDAGQHTHYSAGYLGYNNNQIMDSAKKVCRFFEDHWEDLVKLSRRMSSQLGWCKKRNIEITKDTDFQVLARERYYAVNLQNLFTSKRNTIEIRLPRGTLRPQTARATIDFFRHIVRNAKNISWKNIGNLKLWFKGIKDKNTIDYIKSRKAFEGEF